MSKITVYVLLSSHNDYNQYGRYYLGVFPKYPTAEDLKDLHIGPHAMQRLLETGYGGDGNDVEFEIEKEQLDVGES